MDRRTFLAGIAGVTGLLAGCSETPRRGTSPTPSETETPTDTPISGKESNVENVHGVELPVPRSELHRGADRDAIPAITEPAFEADWSGVDANPLADNDRVLGIERAGEARAYPLRVLAWHEVVNDEVGGPLLVTYCPLCGSGVVAERRVGGEAAQFGVSGLLWNSDLVMYDAQTRSLWSQIAATAIRGPATGNRLSLVPASLTTWATWREDHPDTRVLLPPPRSRTLDGIVERDYDTNPYSGYIDSNTIGVGGNTDLPTTNARLHPKERVLGVASDGHARAYPLATVRKAGVVNDSVGNLPVVIAVAADGETMVAYNRSIDGRARQFGRASERHLEAAGSRWKLLSGRAVDGPHEGRTLAVATTKTRLFWFAWLDFYPETNVYREVPETQFRPADGGDRRSPVAAALAETEEEGESNGGIGGLINP